MLTRGVATLIAVTALVGPVNLAQAQSDNERQDMLRGGSTKKGIYNVLGLDGTDFSRTTVRYIVSMRQAPSSSIRQSDGSISSKEAVTALR